MDKSADSKEHPKYFTPDPSYRVHSWMGDYTWTYNEFVKDPEKFWDNIAKKLHWFSPYDKVCEWNYPYAKWFVNGKTNITLQLPRPARARGTAQQGSADLEGRAAG